jgi:UDP-N-acetylglucosamine 2-epimerase
MIKKTVVTVTGIRPDFIRMSEIFKKLDEEFNHIMIHTGQHYDDLLSGSFFKDLNLRQPDFNLGVGHPGKPHYDQVSDASEKLIQTLESISKVDCVVYLGDSNSVLTSVPLKKEGYKIAHIEAGMRSHDNRMFEEINRKVCDTVSDIHFVYHENYKKNLLREGHKPDNIYVVGNTIVEVINKMNIPNWSGHGILLDIHRPENFLDKIRMQNLLDYIKYFREETGSEVKMLNFERTTNNILYHGLLEEYKEVCEFIPLQKFRDYLDLCKRSRFIISDSGTAQEEPALLAVPVIVPRSYTERPESVEAGCSYMIDLDTFKKYGLNSAYDATMFINEFNPNIEWLGDGNTSTNIINILKDVL